MGGPFAEAAMVLRDYGLAPIPLGGVNGKHPRVRGFSAWTEAPSRQTYVKWCGRYADENIGAATGPPSGIFVVDADERGLEDKITERFGPTPLWVTSPRDAAHAYYRYGDEPCGDLRKEGLPIDLKGMGGMIILPPSVRRYGEFAGKRYELRPGCTWDMLRDLPRIKPSALPKAPASVSESGADAVSEGRRNDTLFRHLLRAARHVDDIDALIDVARTFVDQRCDRGADPVDDYEILKTAKSAWRYQTEGRNWGGGERMVSVAGIPVRADQHREILATCPDVILLMHVLRERNWRLTEFSAAPKWLARERVIAGWGHERYRHALAECVEQGLLVVTHQGGGKVGDPTLYKFAQTIHF